MAERRLDRAGRAAGLPDVDRGLVEVERGSQRAPTPRPVGPVRLRGSHEAIRGQLLSPRQRQIVLAAAEGLTYGGIAHRVGCARHTVKNHVAVILRKLGAANLTQAVAIVVRGEDVDG